MLKNLILMVSDIIAVDFSREPQSPPEPTTPTRKGMVITLLIFMVGLVGGMACVGVPLALTMAEWVLKHKFDDDKPTVVFNYGDRASRTDDNRVPAVEESSPAPPDASSHTKAHAPSSTRNQHGIPSLTPAKTLRAD